MSNNSFVIDDHVLSWLVSSHDEFMYCEPNEVTFSFRNLDVYLDDHVLSWLVGEFDYVERLT
jgi:hypothetical protein